MLNFESTFTLVTQLQCGVKTCCIESVLVAALMFFRFLCMLFACALEFSTKCRKVCVLYCMLVCVCVCSQAGLDALWLSVCVSAWLCLYVFGGVPTFLESWIRSGERGGNVMPQAVLGLLSTCSIDDSTCYTVTFFFKAITIFVWLRDLVSYCLFGEWLKDI